MVARELVNLIGGLVFGAVLSYVAIYSFWGRGGGIGDWGWPFIWKEIASGSPAYVFDYPARYEDVVFWLAFSVIVVEVWAHIVWPRLKARETPATVTQKSTVNGAAQRSIRCLRLPDISESSVSNGKPMRQSFQGLLEEQPALLTL